MDVNKALRELHEEKRRLDITIAALEARLGSGSRTRGRRGRKSMSAAERLEVSKRMSKYWEARRASAASLQDDASQSESERQSGSELQPKSAAAVVGSSSSLSA
jgi:hypothetical protein